MDILSQFCDNGHLFRCEHDQFNDHIKTALINILLNKYQPKMKVSRTFLQHCSQYFSMKKCMICCQLIFNDHNFIICDECCYICINNKLVIVIIPRNYGIRRLICQKYGSKIIWNPISMIHNHFPQFVPNSYVKMDTSEMIEYSHTLILRLFVNNSHKLLHRFYHTTSIIFLTSINDNKSLCSVFNLDIVIYILKFIY